MNVISSRRWIRVQHSVGLAALLLFALLARAVATPASTAAIYAGLPVMFEANQGQTDARVKFLARGPGYSLFLTQQEAVLDLQPLSAPRAARHNSVLRLKFLGASPGAQVFGRNELRGKTNYLLGNDPQQWHRGVSNYAAAEYRDLYAGVDAVFHGTAAGDGRQRIEFDFEVAAGADASRVALQVDGARRIQLSREGDVLVGLGGQQEVVLGKPRVYQEIGGRRHDVVGEFKVLARHRLAFALGPYDHSQALIIDPTLTYSTYIVGGEISGIAVDPAGHAYIVGTTGGNLAVFPNPGAYQTTCAACEFIGSAFVAKYDTTQSGAASLIYSTFLGPAQPPGGNLMADELGTATGGAIAFDAAGDAYVTGSVNGSAGNNFFPTTAGALFPVMPGGASAFVTVLGPTGETLLASTFLGGNNSGGSSAFGQGDRGTAIAVDGSNNVYVAGLTNSPGLSTPGAAQQKLQNGFLGGTPFVAKLNSGLNQLSYFTYLGGSSSASGFSDTVMAIALDAAGEAYLVGGTFAGACSFVSCTGGASAGFPIPANAGFQPGPGGTNESGYLAKLNAGGTQLLYFTYLGGGAEVSGTANGTKINALALDAGGNAYVTGITGQIRLPTTGSVVGPVSTACQSTGNGTACPGGFVAEISPGGSGSSSLVFLTYLGGISSGNASTTVPAGIGIDSSGDIYVAGSTSTSDMPLSGIAPLFTAGAEPSGTLPCIALLPNCVSAFLVELESGATSVLFSGYLAGAGAPGTGNVKSEQDSVVGMALDSHSNVYLAGSTATNDFPVTANAYDQISGSSYLAVIGGLPSSAGVASVANYTYNGQAPSLGLLGSVFTVSAPATTSLAVPVVLTNSGAAALAIGGISLVGSASPPWSFTSVTCNGTPVALPIAAPVNVGAGQACTILLQFAPTLVQAGQAEGLQILDNAASSNASGNSSEQVIFLDGTGTAAPAASFATYSFNGQTIVQANGLVPAAMLTADVNAAATGQLVMTNTGGEPFTISGVSVPASIPPSPWSVTGVACPSSVTGAPTAALPVTLAPLQTCSINLQFAPTALGTFDAALNVLDTASGSNLSSSGSGQEILVQGTGGQPNAQYSVSSGQISASNTQVTFGNVPDNTPATQTVTVTNNGNGPLTLTNATIAVSLRALSTAAYWSLLKDCNAQSGGALFPVTVAPGASCVFTFQFDPAATGNFVALVSFFDNSAQSNLTSTLNGSYIQQVKLYGVGVLPLSGQVSSMTYTPEQLTFTNTSGTQNQAVTVSNTGTQNLVIQAATLGSSQDVAFTLVQQGCIGSSGTLQPFPVTLASGASCVFTFQYNAAVEEQKITGPNGVPPVVDALFLDNAYETNIGSSFSNVGPTQGFALLAPRATNFPGCGSSSGVGVSGSGLEGGAGGAWSTTITISSLVAGRGLSSEFLVVLEGLNTTFNEVAGTTPTDAQSAYSCGDVPGSPTVLINATGVTGFGAGVPVQSASVTVHFANGLQPVYQSLAVRAD